MPDGISLTRDLEVMTLEHSIDLTALPTWGVIITMVFAYISSDVDLNIFTARHSKTCKRQRKDLHASRKDARSLREEVRSLQKDLQDLRPGSSDKP